MSEPKPLVKIAPNNPVFDLPVLVGIEEKLFLKHGLDVQMSAPYEAREKDSADRPIMARLKENLFDCGSADSYNVCEWASIDRLERGKRGGNIAGLRSAVAAQAILSFEEALQVPRDLADVPVVVQELTGSHYTTIHKLESAVGSCVNSRTVNKYLRNYLQVNRAVNTTKYPEIAVTLSMVYRVICRCFTNRDFQ